MKFKVDSAAETLRCNQFFVGILNSYRSNDSRVIRYSWNLDRCTLQLVLFVDHNSCTQLPWRTYSEYLYQFICLVCFFLLIETGCEDKMKISYSFTVKEVGKKLLIIDCREK
nr:NADH dehydrogenase subunit 4L [Sanicula orthacantha var. stolonifera]